MSFVLFVVISTCNLEIQYISKLSNLFLPTEAALTAVYQIYISLLVNLPYYVEWC